MLKLSYITCETCGEIKNRGVFKRKLNNPLCRTCYAKTEKVKIAQHSRRQTVEYKAKDRLKKSEIYKFPDKRALILARVHKYRDDNREKIKQRGKDYYERQDVQLRIKEYRRTAIVISKRKKYFCSQNYKEWKRNYNQKPEVLAKIVAYSKNIVDSLSDTYLKGRIRSQSNGVLKSPDIPIELIEMKRRSIELKRTIKQKKEENEQHTTTDL